MLDVDLLGSFAGEGGDEGEFIAEIGFVLLLRRMLEFLFYFYCWKDGG